MNFLRLNDPLLSVLFSDEDILAIDKPYGFNAHTNDSKIEHSEFIQDGLIEIYEKQFGVKLHIIHRLDQTTTGVMIFGKSADSAKKYAEYFFHRQVKKTYWFLTQSKSAKSSFTIEQPILHKGKELEAKTDLTLQKKTGDFELWLAHPFTGRNHQIRIHAQAAGISILGDTKYGGREFPFLCLHNQQIEFPNGVVIRSQPPIYFENMEILKDLVLTRTFFEADRRQRLFSSAPPDQSFRLAKVSAKEGEFSIDKFGKIMVLNWHKEKWTEADLKRFSFFASSRKKPILVKLGSEQQKQLATPILIQPGTPSTTPPSSWTASEGQTNFQLSAEGSSWNLSPSQRLQRNWCRENAKGLSVLSLFSLSSGFALSAALGGASQVTAVELNKNALSFGKETFSANGLKTDGFKFLCRDSLTFLEQAISKNLKYDLIICESPAFMRREKGVYKIATGLGKLLENCLLCLNQKGTLLFSTNAEDIYIADIGEAVLQAQKKLKISGLSITNILPGLDMELPDERSALKSFLVQLT